MSGERFLRALDRIRGLPGRIKLRDNGLRLYTVTIRVRTWSGTRPGVDASTSTDADTVFWVDAGTHKTRVVQVTQRDIVASGGVYTDQDVKVGPITPLYTTGGYDITAFDPNETTAPAEVLFRIDGPGMGSSGAWFRKVGQDVTKPFSYYFTLRRTAETP
jgi:hypothetical protein